MTLAALEATLRLYRDERQAFSSIPTLQMIATPLENLQERARHLASLIVEVDADRRLVVQVVPSLSQVGGGSVPGQDLETYAVAVSSLRVSTQRMEMTLRKNRPPIIGRIESDRYLMDVRTLQRDDPATIQQAFAGLLGGLDH
jgi:L-seryl-tRNA(Ser) seleniumtransferase